MSTRQVCEIMARDAAKMPATARTLDAIAFIEETDAPICVVDEAGEVVGVIAEAELEAFVKAIKLVSCMINRNFFPVREDANPAEVARIFASDPTLSALPVFSAAGELVGAITRQQIAEALAAPGPAPATDERARPTRSIRRPDRPSPTTRLRNTLATCREKAAEMRRQLLVSR